MSDAPSPTRHTQAAQSALEATVLTTRRVLNVAVLGLTALLLGQGAFTVSEQEVAFVRRLGRVRGYDPSRQVLGSGLHFALPVVDEIVRIPVGASTTATDAFSLWLSDAERLSGKVKDRRGGLDPSRDGYLIALGGAFVHGRPWLRCRIRDPLLATENVSRPDVLAAALLERGATQAALTSTVDELVGAGRTAPDTGTSGFFERVRRSAQDVLDGLHTGLEATGVGEEPLVGKKGFVPPAQVNAAIQAVEQAIQQRERSKSEALSLAREARAKAEAVADRVRAQARSDARRLLSEAETDAAVFKDRRAEEQKSATALRERLLLAALDEAFSTLEEAFVVRAGQDTRLHLERDRQGLREELRAKVLEGAR